MPVLTLLDLLQWPFFTKLSEEEMISVSVTPFLRFCPVVICGSSPVVFHILVVSKIKA